MPRNIVVCCDGTNNEYGDANSNVVHLYRSLVRDLDAQAAMYDPGVGTFATQPFLTKTARGVSRALGAAFGRGISANILDAYRFLMQSYQDGDRVFIFGFSRGAYTARAIAAMTHKVGLLLPDNESLVDYALKVFKQEREKEVYEGFRETFARPCPTHFLGLWDTVSSVGWVWNPVTYQYTANNSSVSVIRHAISLDERRAFFRQNQWGRRFEKDQDLKEVWFPGVHSDVGGGYDKSEAGLSKLALEWMLVEAAEHGLLIDPQRAQDVLSKPVGPDHKADAHDSLTAKWLLGEIWPKLSSKKGADGKWRKRPKLNLGRPRRVADGSCVHQSAVDRKNDRADYTPKNWPANHTVEGRRDLATVLSQLAKSGAAGSPPMPPDSADGDASSESASV